MKLFILAVLVALASANDFVDWSHVRPMEQLLNEYVKENAAPRERRIVNGQPAAPHQFPYQVALLMSSASVTSLCGGSVISHFSVLTAAHCTVAGVQSFLIIAGAHNRNIFEPNQQRRTVLPSDFIQHPNYGPLRLINDIAVLRFTQAYTFNQFVQPVVLASDDSNRHVGASVHVSGFGRVSDSNQLTSEIVLFTVKTVISNAVCAQSFPLLVVDSTICATGTPGINNSVCNGDSGGPLTIRDGGNNSVQVGVVSFGSPNGCELGFPDGYARVSTFHPWILSVARFSISDCQVIKMRLAILAVLICFSSSVSKNNASFLDISDGAYQDLIQVFPKEASRERKILNGIPATPHQFPYQVAILAHTPSFTHLCGGSIISHHAVLTAAHCLYEGTSSFIVIAGANNRNQLESNQQRRNIDLNNFISHPDFNSNRLLNDVAIIKFAEAFTFNQYVQPIELAANDEERFEGSSAVVSGFGIYDRNFRESDIVMYAEKTVISNFVCLRTFPMNVISSTICAVSKDGADTSVCIGDSGSPLTIRQNETPVLIGVVSFPIHSEAGCGTTIPNGFARVSSFNAWIRETANF
ncbi:transmembrane protease serine 9-like [Chironomus tepperi]|uniref:transmembrane protease serine 9-like n=1 Tax=Chironomus tepperi TaxID=113505 RepID=UPI00391FB4FA